MLGPGAISAALALVFGGAPFVADDFGTTNQSWGGGVGRVGRATGATDGTYRPSPAGATGGAYRPSPAGATGSTVTPRLAGTARTTGTTTGTATGTAKVAGPFSGARPDKDPGRRVVAVVRTADVDRISQEIVTRIIAELVATGVPVMVLTCSTADSSCLPIAGVNLSAIVLVQRRNNVRAVEVRAGDGLETGTQGTMVAISDERGRAQRLADGDARWEPAALAIRTVELLKAMFPEGADVALAEDSQTPRGSLDPEGPQPLPRAPEASNQGPVEQHADPDADPEPAIARAADGRAIVPAGPHNVTTTVGIAAIGGFSGLQTAYGPALSIGRLTSDHVLLSFVLEGPAFGPDQSGPRGTASIRQEIAIVQADLVGLFWKYFVLRAGIGAGVYHVHVDGTASGSFTGPNGGMFDPFAPATGSAGAFSWLLSWSAGIVANLRQDVGIFLEGRMFVLTPTQVVSLGGQELGRAGNPGITLSGGVELRF